jgi:putative transposase
MAAAERRRVLNLLRQDRFDDQAPAEVYASLLNEGATDSSIRTIYRILQESNEIGKRR